MSETIRVAEGETFTYQLTAVGDSGGPGNIFAWEVLEDTASAADFPGGVLPSGRFFWPVSGPAPVISFAILDDALREGNETFVLDIQILSEVPFPFDAVDGVIAASDDPVAAIAPSTLTQLEGDGGVTIFTYFVTLNRPAPDGASISWFVIDTTSTPASGADFDGGFLPSGTITVLPGESGPFAIDILVEGDATVEPDESFGVVLSRATSGIVIGPAGSATGTILNDDVALASIAPASLELAEGNGSATSFVYTVTLDRPAFSLATASVAWQVSGTGPNAATAADFPGGSLPGGTLFFEGDVTSATITIPVLGDRSVEPDEDYVVTLSEPSGPIVINPAASSATGRVLDDDTATLTITAATPTAPEGEEGTTTAFVFTLALDRPASGSATVAWAVSGAAPGGADAADFPGGAFPAGSAVFGPEDTTATITVPVRGDGIVEPDEAFVVTLSSPDSSIVLGPTTSATGTILNDDRSLATIRLAEAAADEGGPGGGATFLVLVELDQPVAEAQSVLWSVSGTFTNAATPADFAAATQAAPDGRFPSDTLGFAPGQASASASFSVLGEGLVEADETFLVSLSSPSSELLLSSATFGATGTIRNDDAPAGSAAIFDLVPPVEFDWLSGFI